MFRKEVEAICISRNTTTPSYSSPKTEKEKKKKKKEKRNSYCLQSVGRKREKRNVNHTH